MRLPKSVQEIASVLGPRKAVRLVRNLPQVGKRERRRCLHIPTPVKLRKDHKLVEILGWDDALSLAKELGGIQIQPAQCRYLERAVLSRQIIDLYDLGYSLEEIVERLEYSYRWVEKVTEAWRLYCEGASPSDISEVLGINLVTLGYMLRAEVPEPTTPIKRRGHRRRKTPQLNLALGTGASGEGERA